MEIMGITDTRYKTASQLTDNPRTLKRMVQEHNNRYGLDKDETHKWYILSCRLGYRLTKDLSEIEADLDRRSRNAKKMLKRISAQRASLKKMRNASTMGGLF